ncbi:hypothetical protein AJ79_08131 [Helicocarpus griseus UAMH5409]|uniref:Uncharacterized protein n=1 Tax=Helicocarpus griseus UAMH5409 TaxID=1447875 RepID=A0A2B7WW45_9EURO|nr:hypothetical protein AJ79_08131 [Helicocarpus griseus UAMH5409]
MFSKTFFAATLLALVGTAFASPAPIAVGEDAGADAAVQACMIKCPPYVQICPIGYTSTPTNDGCIQCCKA